MAPHDPTSVNAFIDEFFERLRSLDPATLYAFGEIGWRTIANAVEIPDGGPIPLPAIADRIQAGETYQAFWELAARGGPEARQLRSLEHVGFSVAIAERLVVAELLNSSSPEH